jgi:hypothetical protein
VKLSQEQDPKGSGTNTTQWQAEIIPQKQSAGAGLGDNFKIPQKQPSSKAQERVSRITGETFAGTRSQRFWDEHHAVAGGDNTAKAVSSEAKASFGQGVLTSSQNC